MAVAPINPAAAGALPLTPANAGTTTAGMLQLAQGLGQGAPSLGASPASFQDFLADAVKKTEGLEQTSDKEQEQLLVGNVDNIHDVMIAMEKADIALQLTMAVRNKVIDAYTEVMRMSI